MTVKYNEQKIENYFEALEKSYSGSNFEDIKEAVRKMRLNESAEDTICSFLASMKRVSPLIDFTLREGEKQQVEDLALTINEDRHPEYQSYAEWTKADDKQALQNFFKHIVGEEKKDEFFRDIRLTPKNSDRPSVEPEDLIVTEEAERMVRAAEHPRDKAFLALLWDSGMRRKEIAELKWKDAIIKEDGLMKVNVREGKNGPRRIFLYECVPWITSWLDEYPRPGPDDSLWIDTRSTKGKKQIGYRALEGIVEKARKAASIPKRRKTNLHAWRKARATDMAWKGMNIPTMERFFGWVRGSRMPKIYVQLADVDVENQIRDIYGLNPVEKRKDILGESLDGRKSPHNDKEKRVFNKLANF